MDIGSIGSIGKTGNWPETPSVAINAGVSKAIAKEVSAALTNSAVQEPDASTAKTQVDQALQSINKTLQSLSPNLEFSVDEDSQRTIVKVMDQETKEVIRQMPSAEAIEISKALEKLQGLLIKLKA